MRLLLVANRTCPRPALPGQVLEHVGAAKGEVLVLVPALNSRLRHWVSDVDAAVSASRVMISTWPAGTSNWLEKDLPNRAAERFGLPIHHVVSPYDLPVNRAVA